MINIFSSQIRLDEMCLSLILIVINSNFPFSNLDQFSDIMMLNVLKLIIIFDQQTG